MTSRADMRTFLHDIINIINIQGPELASCRFAIQGERLEVKKILLGFKDDGITSLCVLVRKLGGQIDNPNNVGQHISNPGFNILAICKKRLQLV